MAAKRNRALMGLAAATALAAASPAGAMIVLTQTPSGIAGLTFGTFDLASYLTDAQGRTFAISSARLSAVAHSDPSYGIGVVTTVDTFGNPQIIGTNPPAFELNVSRVVTTTFSDNFADSLTLSSGFLGSGTLSVGGTVSQVLDTVESADGGVSDGPIVGGIFPGVQHTTLTNVTVHHAVYGTLDLGLDFDAAGLAQANLFPVVGFALTPGLGGGFGGGFGGFNPLDPSQSFNTNLFTVDSVTFAFDLTQTGGPPPDAPQLSGGVPEPAAWALMILGLGAVGGTLRRRRALSALA